MKIVEPVRGRDPLLILRDCDGFYERPAHGPLVGYTGRYEKDGKQLQYVGHTYANFSKAETQGKVLRYFSILIAHKFPELDGRGDGFCGAPEGGKALASNLATHLGKGYIFPEKETIELKTSSSREKSRLVWGRHAPEPGEKWWLVEDICNNFSTTAGIIKLVESAGAQIIGIVCFLNRSLTVDNLYSQYPRAPLIPVKALVRKKITEYKQDDSEVAELVQAGR